MPKRPAHPVFIVSDGTCRTCDQVVQAALVQFEGQPVEITLYPDVRTKEDAIRAVREAAQAGAVLFHTLVSEENRVALRAMAEELFVPTCDVLGPTISALNSVLHSTPTATPGLFYEREKAYFDRIDAIDYTLKHDDGARVHDLDKADVILVGVSRVSKSSTCFYLAYRGIRAANVPLLAGHDPPPELLKIDPAKVIGLYANIHRLQSVRQARLHSIGAEALDHYADRFAVAREARAANTLMKERGWRRIDVSYRAIEEVAREVMRLMGSEPRDIDNITDSESE